MEDWLELDGRHINGEGEVTGICIRAFLNGICFSGILLNGLRGLGVDVLLKLAERTDGDGLVELINFGFHFNFLIFRPPTTGRHKT
jgi:hypothetical protein